jgi:hypothetical protein
MSRGRKALFYWAFSDYFFQLLCFFFTRRYKPGWVLACFTISSHSLLSLHFSLQFRIFIFFQLSFSNRNPFHALVVLLYTIRNYSLETSQHCKFFQGAVAGRTPNHLPRRTGVFVLVWAITFDLSGMGGSTSSYATAGIALRIIWPLKPSHYFKVETPSGSSYSTFLNCFPVFLNVRGISIFCLTFLKTLENIGQNHIVLRLVKFLLSRSLLHLLFPSIDTRYKRITAETLRNLQSYEESVSQ